MKKLLFFLFILSIISCKQDKYPDLNDGIYAEIITNKGVILALLEYEKTPNTVANFISISQGTNNFVEDKFKNKNFYDGMLFQRNDMVIQTGDPKGEGTGTGYVFADEFPHTKEGNFALTHDKAGILSMANSGRNTSSSQFFITLDKAPKLDGKHTIFGHVIKGIDIIKTIESDDTIIGIEIIKKGESATKFNAPAVFSKHYTVFKEKKNKEYAKIKEKTDRALKAKKQMRNYFFNNKKLAKKYPSGLRILTTTKGTGEKPKTGSQILIDFSVFTIDGHLFSTSVLKTAEIFNQYDEMYDQDNKYRPLLQIYSDKSSLINGFKEGIQKMEYGEKAMLFIPSRLAYGEKGDGYGIPPDSDLVIEVEILDKVLK